MKTTVSFDTGSIEILLYGISQILPLKIPEVVARPPPDIFFLPSLCYPVFLFIQSHERATMTLAQKHDRLRASIRDLKSVVVAFSGGVDSTLVLALCKAVLGDRTLAVTAQSPSVAARELAVSRRLADEIGVEHRIVPTAEITDARYRENPANRCYYCKSELYGKLLAVAAERGFAYVANGINRDDLGDHRPGIGAAQEAGVVSPLADADLSKQEVRQLARELGLSNWEKPAMPCLSSRVPYGELISEEKLLMIERAEDFLLSLDFSQLRVRHLGDVARIELEKEAIPRFLTGSIQETVRRRFQEIGFRDIVLDPEGFRSGRLNEALTKTTKG